MYGFKAKSRISAHRSPASGQAVDAACRQMQGERPEQQDAWGLFHGEQGLLAVIADGMGGLARGDAAAKKAVEAAGLEAGRISAETSFDELRAALGRINQAVYGAIKIRGILGETGTTLCMAVCRGSHVKLIWSGDSRAYLLRDGALRQLTEDHIYARYLRQLAAEGVLSEQDAACHPNRNHLTGYIGMRELEDFSITAQAVSVLPGDGLLLCTDGLYRTLDAGEMAQCMGDTSAYSAERLIEKVAQRRRRGQDNATALVVKWW